MTDTEKIAYLVSVLEQIEKGEGRFSRDNYEFACNVIEEAKILARGAINRVQES